MYNEQKYETTIHCPECKKAMYVLEGSIGPIYVCSSCGASVDMTTLEKEKHKQSMQNKKESQKKRPLLHNLFSKQFMKKYTDFSTFAEFIGDSRLFNDSLENLSKEAIQNVSERKMNRYVKEHTCFCTWDQMFEKAIEWYLKM